MSTDKLPSEGTIALAKQRRIRVGRRTTESLNKGLENARTAEAVTAARKEMAEQFECAQEVRKQAHLNEIAVAEQTFLETGIKQGKEIAMADYDAMLDESVNNRLCDNERDIPWPVGVMIAGEQHRILQALAESEGDEVAARFSRVLGIIHAPIYLDAPSAVTYRNCEQPPKHVDRDQQGKQIQLEAGDAKLPGYTEHWKYYLRQITETDD